MPDFWRSSGFHLLERDANDHLRVTDDFLRAYFLRPEIRPVEESCDAERALHMALLENPGLKVAADQLSALADPDARENYRVVLDFRDRLLAAGTVEGCYLGFFRNGGRTLPPLFLDQMAHVILRNILGDAGDGLRARAGELFFREQKVTTEDGAIRVADAETIEHYAETGGLGNLGRLIIEAQTPVRSVTLDVLDEASAGLYFGRDEKYDTVLDLSFTQPGLDALARVLEAWVGHFLGIKVSVQPVQKITDERWVWHTGLDSESSQILNALYKGADVEPERLERILALFRLDFADPVDMRADLAGRPVYLGLAMTAEQSLRLKPQNLLVNLPIASRV